MTENTFECIVTLNHDSEVSSLAISESSLLVSGHYDGTILIRNQTSFSIFQTLKGHFSIVYSIVFLNNGNLASGSSDNSNLMVIWQKTNETFFTLINILNSHTSWVNSLAVLSNNMFASVSNDNSIRIWDQNTFECLNVLKDHKNYVNSLVVIRNEYLISISSDQSIIFWDILNNFTRLTTTKTDIGLFSVASLSNDSFGYVQNFFNTL
jgi:WD40 repeat protein